MEDWIEHYGYYGLAAALFLEASVGVGFIVPGLTVLAAAGFFAGAEVLSLWLVLLIAWAAVMVGDWSGYLLGRFGHARSHRLRKLAGRSEAMLESAQDRVWVFFFFHFPVVTRATVPFGLGALKLPLRRWSLISAVAASVFVATIVLAGYTIGRTAGGMGAVKGFVIAIQVLFLVLLAALGAQLLWKRRQRRQAAALAE